MLDVALFPIPGSVNFPWVACTLHVFEPRYRHMVRQCVDEGMYIGVCHTEKALHSNTRQQDMREALSSNQSTYKPCEVLSAGPVEVLQTLDDGRLLIQIDVNIRLRLRQEKQTLPFSIWACEELADDACDDDGLLGLQQCKAKILQRLLTIAHGDQAAQQSLRSDHWQTMSAEKFSFAVTAMLGMQPDLAQHLLEMTDAGQRLETVLEMINDIGPQLS